MTEPPKQQHKAHEQRRLAAALRENLKRRKAQEKAREKGREQGRTAAETTVDRTGAAHDSAGIGNDKLGR